MRTMIVPLFVILGVFTACGDKGMRRQEQQEEKGLTRDVEKYLKNVDSTDEKQSQSEAEGVQH